MNVNYQQQAWYFAIGEGLDITLDGSAVHARTWIQGGWLDANTSSIKKVDFVLGHLQFKEAIESKNNIISIDQSKPTNQEIENA